VGRVLVRGSEVAVVAAAGCSTEFSFSFLFSSNLWDSWLLV